MIRILRSWLDARAPLWLIRLRMRIGDGPIMLAILIVLILIVSNVR